MHAQQDGMRLYASPARDDFIRTTPMMQQFCYPGWTDVTDYDDEHMADLVAEILTVE